jgi:tetratricopeptide (TPR) repeat protein/HAMP domain-containing protein
MTWLNVSYHAIGVFIAFVIQTILSLFLLTQKNKTAPTWGLWGMFTGFGFMLFGYFMAYTVSEPWGAFHRYFTLIALFANGGLIVFSYFYPRLDNPREAKIVIPLWFVIITLAYFEFIFTTQKMEKIFNFTAHFYTFDYGAKTAIIILLSQIWPISVLIRKTIFYSDYNGIFSLWLKKPERFFVYPRYFFTKFIVGWIKFFNPKGKDAVAIKSFVNSFLLLLIIAVSNLLNKSGILSYDLYAFIYANVTLVICFSIIVIYINNSPEPTTFMVKLVGISLVTVLLVLGFVGNLTLSLSEEDYDNQRRAQIIGSKHSILERKYDELPDEIEYILLKPALADVFDKSFKIEFIKKPDVLNAEGINQGADRFRNVTLKETLTKLMKENKRDINKDKPTDEESDEALVRYKKSRQYENIANENLVDENTPKMKRLYRDAGSLYTHFDFVKDNVRYEIGFSYAEYRNHTHHNAVRLIYIILFTTIAILLLFPKFFHLSLVKPLNNLLEGVTKVNEGNLDIEVPIKVQDEIGFLSGSFNSMVASIKQARRELQDYAENLEEKVKERTKEVQEKMEEVQKLKIQQDGDYFLTSLLAKPLFFNANRSKAVTTEFLIHQKKKFEFRNKAADLGGDICITGNLKLGKPDSYNVYTMAMNGDAMGKSMQGAGGSLVMGVVINAIMSRSASNKRVLDVTPEQWLTELYHEVDAVFKSFNGTMVISATILLIEEKTGEMYYFNAEHPATILYRDGCASFIEQELLLRKFGQESEFQFQVYKFKLMPDDVIILGSDGRDDIDLTPNEPVRTINEDETAILGIVEEAKGDIHEMESMIKNRGAITDDLSFMRVEFQPIGLSENIQQDLIQPITTKIEEQEIEIREDADLQIDVTEVYQQSKRLYQEGQINKALEVLMNAYSVEQNNQKLNKLLGLISFKGKDYATAIDVLSRYLQMDPDTEEMWYYLSLSQKKMGNYLASLDASRKVYELHPDNVNNLINLSDLYRLTGHFAEAREYSEKALSLDPNNQNAKKILNFLGNV